MTTSIVRSSRSLHTVTWDANSPRNVGVGEVVGEMTAWSWRLAQLGLDPHPTSNASNANVERHPLEDPLEVGPAKQEARSLGPGLTCWFDGGGGRI